ncbi:hypothetical protein Sango_2987500 [Sesamum angolense]|uniref:DUF4283 domain-containing protein n=1 Tax=Sesamum angolense TaxID=2727404 RepID=A0AAE1T3P4_9LAMI|nr:hypothetical protein Sango_2987500 [Sesamum angolense]
MSNISPDVELLKKAWKLRDEEEEGVTVPGGLWNTCSESQNLCLVGRLLSNRPYHLDSLGFSIQSMFLPVKRVEIKPVSEKLLPLRFNHEIDKKRALDGCPWSFKKNILLLADMREDKNPMHVVVDWCDFHIHVHDLSLNMMNLGVATLIGNRIGIYCGMETDAAGCAWGVSLRTRVGLNVKKLLKRAMKVRLVFDEDILVRIT